jgi:hypothetical protein
VIQVLRGSKGSAVLQVGREGGLGLLSSSAPRFEGGKTASGQEKGNGPPELCSSRGWGELHCPLSSERWPAADETSTCPEASGQVCRSRAGAGVDLGNAAPQHSSLRWGSLF